MIQLCSSKQKTDDPGTDHILSMTFDHMSVHTMSVREKMCYTTAGKTGHAMSNGHISKEYGGVPNTHSLSTSNLLRTRTM